MVPSPRLRDRLRSTTRQAILQAAEEVYARHGLAHGRLEQVAAAAGVSVGTLYNYFADRDELVRELLEERRAALMAQVDAALASSPPGLEARVRTLAGVVLREFMEHRPLFALFLEGDPPPALRADARGAGPVFLSLRDRARRHLARGLREDGRPVRDAEVLAALLVGMLRGAGLHLLAENGTSRPGPLVERVTRVFVHGVGP